jgi:F-type H+-transporting ATPase subunit delta
LATRTLEARRYAQAVYELARERNELDKWSQDLVIVSSLGRDPDFVNYMQDPRYPYEIKSRLLTTKLKRISPLVLNLVLLLTTKNKFGLIAFIQAEYEDLLNTYRGIEKAEVTTAVPLGEEEKKNLTVRLEELSGKKIILSVKVDPVIVGGIIIRLGGKLIDGSTSSRLSALKGELAGSEI